MSPPLNNAKSHQSCHFRNSNDRWIVNQRIPTTRLDSEWMLIHFPPFHQHIHHSFTQDYIILKQRGKSGSMSSGSQRLTLNLESFRVNQIVELRFWRLRSQWIVWFVLIISTDRHSLVPVGWRNAIFISKGVFTGIQSTRNYQQCRIVKPRFCPTVFPFPPQVRMRVTFSCELLPTFTRRDFGTKAISCN